MHAGVVYRIQNEPADAYRIGIQNIYARGAVMHASMDAHVFIYVSMGEVISRCADDSAKLISFGSRARPQCQIDR